MFGQKCIVGVDDSSLIIKMLEMNLSENYEFHGFVKGMRALKYMKDNIPDLIILDMDMPEVDGFEMVRLIKNEYILKDIPILFLTANSGKHNVVRAFQAGVNDYVVKPINDVILHQKIEKLLGDSWD